MFDNVRYSVRSLVKQGPFTTLLAVCSLALALGATTTTYAVLDSTLLRELPYRDPARLVLVQEQNLEKGFSLRVSPANYADIENQNTVFEGIGAVNYRTALLVSRGEPEWIKAESVTAGLLDMMGVAPVVGRIFVDDDTRLENSNVVILSYGFWQRKFNADAGVVGSVIELDGGPCQVIGVMPQHFRFALNPDLWLPLEIKRTLPRGARFLSVVGRLRHGTDLKQAQVEMSVLSGQLEESYPDTNGGWGFKLTPLRKAVVGDFASALFILAGSIVLVFLIACCNLTLLLLARVKTRSKEVAVRVALGARRIDLAAWFMVQSTLLVGAGGALGLLLSLWGNELFLALAPPGIPRTNEVSISIRVVAFEFATVLILASAMTLTQLFSTDRTEVAPLLQAGGHSSRSGLGRRGAFNSVIAVQVALALILLSGATLMMRSLVNVSNVDPGFTADNVTAARIRLPKAKYPDPDRQKMFFEAVLERLASIPGYETGAVSALPIGGSSGALPIGDAAQPVAAPNERPVAFVNSVTPNYFSLLQIPLIEGRFFHDVVGGASTPKMVTVDDAVAKLFWPDNHPIGKTLLIYLSGTPVRHEVVGVVGNVKFQALDGQNRIPAIYVPFAQWPKDEMTIIAASEGDQSGGIAELIRQAVQETDSSQPVSSIRSLQDIIQRTQSERRFYSTALSIFALVALVQALAGVYGLISYFAERRTREIGIRMALGARTSQILLLMLRQQMVPIGVGVLAGLAGSLALTRMLSSMLFGVSPSDPSTLAFSALVLALGGLAACAIPAIRASRIAPVAALRHQ